ncbi:putative GIY-YIG endonuclease, Zinc finger, RING-type, Zinc finger, RING/FYVE/PHD-type, FANCL [Plasmopara halstedii]
MLFFSCYLLTPAQPPRRLRCTYIGFTVSPTRRIRQHNGELVNGAKRTRKFRPWEMVAVVHGFPSKFRALQFEWIWQHPHASKILKPHAESLQKFGTSHSLKRKIVEMLELVNLKPFRGLPLIVTFTNEEIHNIARKFGRRYLAVHCETKALKTFAGVEKVKINFHCFICDNELKTEMKSDDILNCYHKDCEMYCHKSCLKDHFRLTRRDNHDDDSKGECPLCQNPLKVALTQGIGREQNKKQVSSDQGRRIKRNTRVMDSHVNDLETSERHKFTERRNQDNDDEGESFELSSNLFTDCEFNGWFDGRRDIKTDNCQNRTSLVEIIDLT